MRLHLRPLLLVVCLLFVLPASLHSQDAPPKGFKSVEVLWPDGAPGAHGNAVGDVPKLYCYPAPGPGPHTAVVILPGGGYLHVVMEKEGGVEARWLNARGVSAYVLQYRLSPAYHYPSPMLDGARAIRFVRSHAREWDLRPDAIGVWGFSAGGHLAGFLATADASGKPQTVDPIDRESARPDFAILSYARLNLSPEVPGTFGMQTLVGKDASELVMNEISPIKHVSRNTPPVFLYANERDEKVSAINATSFYEALLRADVDAELHIFETGPHGTGMAQNLPNLPELTIWPTLLQQWMHVHKWVVSDEMNLTNLVPVPKQ